MKKSHKILSIIWTFLNMHFGHQLALLFIDLTACWFGMYAGWLFAVKGIGINDPFQNYYFSVAVISLGLVICTYVMRGYQALFLRRPEKELEIIVKSVVLSFLFVFAVNFIVFKTSTLSRYIYIFNGCFILVLIVAGRFGLRRFYRKSWKADIGREKALIVGQDPQSIKWLRNQFHIQQFLRYEMIGYVEKNNGDMYFVAKEKKNKISEPLVRFLDYLKVGTIFFALDDYSKENHQLFLDLLRASQKNGIQIFTLSEAVITGRYVYHNTDQHIGLSGMQYRQSELEKKLPLFFKRLIDICGALCGLILLSPLFIIIAAAVKIQDGGKIIHRRHVVGLNGKTFDAFKFRTMIENADDYLEAHPEMKEDFECNFKLKDDPRITNIGKCLRRLSLDELPQLFNVLIGQMSLVGPRMVTPDELERYGNFKNERIKIRPGLSGYWQISGRQEIDYQERILMDRFYMYRWNLWMDLWIILKTIQKVVKMEGAY